MAANDVSNGRQILLGITGGIAAYKSAELVRRLVDGGAEVQVVMTRAAQEFVSAVTFQALSGRRVRSDLWDEAAEAAMSHIELARWADVVVIAPATANFIASYAQGMATDLLSTLCLATRAPVVLAPAMNQAMWTHPAVEANRALLESRGVQMLGPMEGEQACGETGLGRMMEADAIAATILARPTELKDALSARVLRGVKAVITAGPTREPIDPVRYITNRSSGKMGYAIAAAAQAAGADVVLVSGPVNLPTPTGVRRIDVESADEMYKAVHAEIADTQLFVACAAVSDYKPQTTAQEKIKRSADELKLDLIRSPDTLASVAALVDGPFTVGFAAETQNVAGHARDKMTRKGLDMIAANKVGPSCGFDKETNALEIFWPGGETKIAENAKPVVARGLIKLVAERFSAARRDSKSRATAAL